MASSSLLFWKRLNVVERGVLIFSLALALINLCLAFVKNVDFAVHSYVPVLLVAVFMYGAGLAYRISRRSEEIALAAIGVAGLIVFSASLSTYNYLLLPIQNGTIDGYLSRLDGYFGIYWPGVMEWAASNPQATSILRFAYNSTLPQLALLIVFLGFSGNRRGLDRLVLTLTISGVLVVGFWGMFPSLGAKCMYELPAEIWRVVSPTVDKAYAEELLRIGRDGVGVIDPAEIRGLIAFPSFHVTLAMITLVASWQFRYLFPIFLILNLLILPATMIHGGHHFVDPIGGIVFFLIAHFIVSLPLASIHKTAEQAGVPA